jgi:hypothetical protein
MAFGGQAFITVAMIEWKASLPHAASIVEQHRADQEEYTSLKCGPQYPIELHPRYEKWLQEFRESHPHYSDKGLFDAALVVGLDRLRRGRTTGDATEEAAMSLGIEIMTS